MKKLYDVACIGTCLLDISISGLDFENFFKNEPNLADNISYGCGGDACNQSIVLSRLGYNVCFLGCIGNDFVGKFVINTLTDSGVDVSHISTLESVPTAANDILIGKNDQKVYTISKNRTSRTELTTEDIDIDAVKKAKIVSVGSLFVHEKLDRGIDKILKAAKESDSIICADVCPPNAACSFNQNLMSAFPIIDYMFMNQNEAALLTDKDSPESAAEYMQNLGIRNVIVKLGKNGCYVKTHESSFYHDSFVVNATDTTGAGDCFAAGFISALLSKKPVQDCVEFATACSAVTVQNVGATSGIRDRKQIDDFLKSQHQNNKQ